MLAGFERGARGLVADLRRLQSETASISTSEASISSMVLKLRDAVDRRVAARRGDESVVLVLGERRKMLVADDLADADDAEPDGRFF